ncbi:MAG TPA: hypothetical protein VIY71_05475 [Solirubrobacterales bacterium]
MNRLGAAFQGRKGAVLAVSLIVWALALFDLTLLPRVSSQYLGTLPSKRLVGVTVAPGSLVVTSTDPTSPANLWILSHRDDATRVVGVQLPPPHSRRGVRSKILTPRLRTTLQAVEGTPFDVEVWPGAEPALFALSSPRRSPLLRVISLRTGRQLLESRVPAPPQRSDRRDFFVARWSGPRPDLFVIDRNVNRRRPPSPRRWSIRIYSGESDFKKLAFETSIKKSISRQLSQRDWWLNVGVRRPPKPSLVLVTRGKRTGTGQTEVHVLSGHSGFHRFTLHTGTELPERDGLTRRFVFQSDRRGGAMLMTEIRHGRLRLVPVLLP